MRVVVRDLTDKTWFIVAFEEDVGLLLFQLLSLKSDFNGKYNRVLAQGFQSTLSAHFVNVQVH